MDRNDVVLAALAAAGNNITFTPVQIQKLMFLLDKEASHLVGGPHFDFKPYDYGPFDKNVYDTLETLSLIGNANITYNGRYKKYSLSAAGMREGLAQLEKLAPQVRHYFEEVSRWILGLSFEQLVSSIYQRYPDMKVNSVFRG